VPPCEGTSVTFPLLFSSRKIDVRLPAASAVKRPPVAIGPTELEPPIRSAKPLFNEAAVKDIFCCAKCLAGECFWKIGAGQVQASGIDDIEGKIVAGNVSSAAAKVGAISVRIQLIERANRKKLLPGWIASFIGIKQARTDAPPPSALKRPMMDSGLNVALMPAKSKT